MKNRSQKILMLTTDFLALIFVGLLLVWSIIRIRINEVFPSFTATQLSVNFTLTMIIFCFGGIFGSRLAKRRSVRFSLRLGAVMGLVGFFGTSLMEFAASSALALAILYIFYGVLLGFCFGLSYNECLTSTASQFSQNMGLVTGILLFGYGFSSMLFAFLIESICPYIGIFNVLRLLGVGYFASLMLFSFFAAEPEKAAAAAASENEPSAASSNDVPPREMIRSASFWLYFMWNALMGMASLVIMNSAGNIALYFGLTAALGLIVSAFNGASRPFTGLALDKLGRDRTILIVNLLMITAGILLLVGDRTRNPALMIGSMICVGICFGSLGTSTSKVLVNLYGMRYYSQNLSILNLNVAVAGIIGPILSGILQDLSHGGFTTSFAAVLVIAVIDFIILMVFFRLEHRKHQDAAP